MIKDAHKNLIFFCSGFKEPTYVDLFNFYEEKEEVYQINTIIVKKIDETIIKIPKN